MPADDLRDAESNRLTLRRIVERIPLYLALALAGIAAVVLLVAFQIYFGIDEISAGWWGFVGFTGALVWIVVHAHGNLWIRPRFWLIVIAFVVIHSSVFVAVLRAFPGSRPIWFVPIIGFEAGILESAFVLLCREKHVRKHHDNQQSL